VRRLEAVIFDMDGLMVDSEHLHSRSFEVVLNRHGVKPKVDDVIQTLGIGTPNNWKKLKKQYGLKASVDELSDQKHEVYDDLIPEIELMPGAKALFDDLQNSGIAVAVASGSSKHNIEKILNQLEISSYFSVIISGEELENAKPAPDIFLAAAKALGVEPKNCAVLEDAESGILAAKAADMLAVAVPNEFGKNEDFSKADHIFDSLEQLSAKKLKELI